MSLYSYALPGQIGMCRINLTQYLFKKSIFFHSSCQETASQGWGKIVARYVRDQWICLRFVLNSFPALAQGCEETSVMSLSTVERSKEILQSALEALSILPSDQVLPVFDCMKVLVPKVKDKPAQHW